MSDPSEDRTTAAQPLQNNGLPTEEMANSGNQAASGSWYGQPTQPEGDVPGQQAGQQFGQQPGQQFGQQFGPMPGQVPGQTPGQAPGPWGQPSGSWGQAPAAPGPTAPLDPWGEQSTQAAMPPATPMTDPPPFGSAAPPFGAAQPAFGPAQSPYDTAQPPYGAAQPQYGTAQPTFGPAQPTFGPAQSPYDAAQPPYGAAQYPYGAAQPPYDGMQPPTDGFGYQYANPGPMPQPKSSSGRNAVIAVGSLAVVTALVVALIVTNHHSSNNNAGPIAHTSSVASLTPTATTSATDTTTSEDTQSTSTALAFDPNELNSASTDPTPFTTAALLPQNFSDSKNVPYSLVAGGQESCISSSMSSDVQSELQKYGCTTKMTGSYTVDTSTVNSNDDVLVSVQIFAFKDAATAKAVYASFPANGSWDFGIWCPKTGYGANPCSTNADYQDAYKSDWIGQDYRYVVEATALYTNLSTDSSNKAWTSAAADEAISATGPEYYISTQG